MGDFGSYSELKGIEQPGFMNRTNFLLRWDIQVSPSSLQNKSIILISSLKDSLDMNMKQVGVVDSSCSHPTRLFKVDPAGFLARLFCLSMNICLSMFRLHQVADRPIVLDDLRVQLVS